MTIEIETNHALDTARSIATDIVAMLEALDVDYNRLEEFQDTDDHDLTDQDREEWVELSDLANGNESEDQAREALQEHALSVEVRSGWDIVGGDTEAAEFKITICTGGPAVRVMGELDHHGQPCRAWLEYQDWGTPWTQYFDVSQATLIAYAQSHYFEER
tara:strand:- start:6563 stop:7042 length:480 start_codon:yes stop_codon:yes gene_type:complete